MTLMAKRDVQSPTSRGADGTPRKLLVQDWWHTRLTLLLDRPLERVAMHRVSLDDRLCCLRQRIAMARLTENMSQQGQLQPVVLRLLAGHPKLHVVSGFRRVLAAQHLGWPVVDAIVIDDVTDQDAFHLAVFDNERAGTLTDLDRARVLARCRALGFSVDDLATRLFHLSKRQVERLEALLRLPAVIQDAIADQDMTTSHGLALLQCAARHDTDTFDFEAWTRLVAEEQLTVAQLQVRLALAGFLPGSGLIRVERGANRLRLVTRAGCLELGDLKPEQRAELRTVLQEVIDALDATATQRELVSWSTAFEI